MLIYTPGKAERTSHIVIKSITKQNKLTKINNQTGLHYPLQQKLPGIGHHLYHLPRSFEVCSNSTRRRKASPVNRSHPMLSSLQSGAFVTMITNNPGIVWGDRDFYLHQQEKPCSKHGSFSSETEGKQVLAEPHIDSCDAQGFDTWGNWVLCTGHKPYVHWGSGDQWF